jgi:ABC-type spermidine/putrescine transport system permease subunit II
MTRAKRLRSAVGWIYCWLVVLFVLSPVIIIVPASFGASESLQFPPASYSLKWYEQVLGDRQWLASAGLSVRIAAFAAVAATVAGLLVGLAHLLARQVSPGLRAFLMLPMVAPHIVLATGLFSVLLNLRLLGDPTVLALVHASLAIPLTAVLFVNAVDSVDPLLWTAASSLGARWWTILRQILLPLLLSSFIVAFVLGFMVSWDEVTFAVFVGPNIVPSLPARMFYYLKEVVTPALAAVATLLIALTAMVGAVVLVARRFARASTRSSPKEMD